MCADLKGAHLPDVKGKARRGPFLFRIPTEGVLRLGHADGQITIPKPGVSLYVMLCLLFILHLAGTINFVGNCPDLVL